MERNKNPSKKVYNIYVVQEKNDKLYLYIFGSKEFVQPAISAMQYKLQLRTSGDGNAHVFGSDASLRNFLKKNSGKNIYRGRIVQQNPRNSRVKDALNDEATRYEDFSDFAVAYWNACSRGLYWYATDEKKFHIGEHERKLIDGGKFRVYCSPALALKDSVNEGKKFVAELDVTRVPSKSIALDRRSDGESVRLTSAAGSIQVSRVMDADKAMRAFAWQASLLPSSKEELREVWKSAWKKRERVAKISEVRRRAEAEREGHRAKIRSAKESAAESRARKKEEREEAKKIRAQERRKRAKEKAAKARAEEIEKVKKKAAAEKERAEAASSSKHSAKEASRRSRERAEDKAKKPKGKYKKVIISVGKQANPSTAVRMVPSFVNNPEG